MDQRVQVAQEKSKVYHDRRRDAQHRAFTPGSWVRVKKPEYVAKGTRSFLGPFKVKEMEGPKSYKMTDGTTWNVESLLPFYGMPPRKQVLHLFPIIESESTEPDMDRSSRSSRPQRNRRLPL